MTLPAKWAICDDCSGEGTTCRIGAMTGDEFNRLFDTPEDRDDYAAGAYNGPCPADCVDGKILVIDRDRSNPAQVAAFDEAEDEIAEMHAIQAAEMRAGC